MRCISKNWRTILGVVSGRTRRQRSTRVLQEATSGGKPKRLFIIPAKEAVKPGKGWMTEEILKSMDERRLVKNRNDAQYIDWVVTFEERAMRQRRDGLTKSAEKWKNGACANLTGIYDKVRKLSQKKGNSWSGSVRSEDGVMLAESQDICCREDISKNPSWRQRRATRSKLTL